MSAGPRPSISQLAGLYRSGTLSPVEVARETLRRIERLDPALNSYLTLTADRALEQAARAEREIRAGRSRGPLHGIPYAAKDLLDTAGIRTTVGSKILSANVPASDAAIVSRLEEAGAVLVGKTGLHEWAYGITSDNPHFGPVRNPWDTERIPGGSSGGSAAALAAGLCAFSLGSDTGGSIRIPAALCGITGLKPTFGRISRRGAFPLGHTLDTLGPFGLSAEDTAWVYAATAEMPVEAADLRPEPRLDSTVLGVPSEFFYERLDPDVDAALRSALQAFESLGASVREVRLPAIEPANSLHRLILLAEATSVHRRRLEQRRQDFGQDVRALLDQGRFVLATDYLDAQRLRRAFCRRFEAVFESVAALVLPAIPIPTARIGELEIEVDAGIENVRLATTRNIRALNLTGLPVLSVPCGFRRDGMPVGMQVVGPMFGEARILEIGHAYQQATGWHEALPPMLREPPSESARAAP